MKNIVKGYDRIAYEAYVESKGGSHLTWKQLNDIEQAAWWSAACALFDMYESRKNKGKK